MSAGPFPFKRNDAIQHDVKRDFVARTSSAIESEAQLFTDLQRALLIPRYFGHNWDALHECLSDLEWIPQQRIVLLHDGAPRLPQRELTIYLSVLRDGVEALREGGKEFFVAFPDQARTLLDAWDGVKPYRR